MFNTICPHCLHEYSLDDSLLGKTATCKYCRRIFLLEEHVGSSQSRIESSSGTSLGGTRTFGKDESSFILRVGDAAPQVINESEGIDETGMNIHQPFPPDSGMWNVGELVLGVYEVRPFGVDQPYAEGGIGIVNRVYHREWDMELAVKSPKIHIFQSENGKQSFEREAQTWIELGLHPNIVTCYLVRRVDDIPRLFSEFVPDGSLRDWLKTRRLYEGGSSAAILRILNVATQIAWGLAHAHQHQLLHLDIKPGNVMMSGQVPKVSDFGLAKHNEVAMTRAEGMTPGFCSPEQYLGFAYSKRKEYDKIPPVSVQSDIWSFAVTLFTMFCGHAPCKKGGHTARQVLKLYLGKDLSGNQPEMPKAIIELLFQCFELDPRKRPESMEQVADRLMSIYHSVSGLAFPRQRPPDTSLTPESLNNRAASMLDLHKPTEAVQLLQQAAKMQPWQPEITYNQTLLAWRMAKITDTDAVAQLETLVKTRSQLAHSHYALGLLHRERGNISSAVEAFESALERDSRKDIHRALFVTEPLLGKNARCIDRLAIEPGKDGDLLIDSNHSLLLIPANDGHYVIKETTTGRIRSQFHPPKQSDVKRLGLSEDLLWELVRMPLTTDLSPSGTSPQEIIGLKRVGAPMTSTLWFHGIGWRRRIDSRSKERQRQNVRIVENSVWQGVVNEGLVEVFHRERQEKIGELVGHDGTVSTLSFSENGQWAVSGGIDQTLRLWELPSCRCLRTFSSLGGGVDAVFFCNNNINVLSLVGHSLRIWDVSILCCGSLYHAPIMLSNITSVEEIGRVQSEMNKRCDTIKNSIKDGNIAAALKAIKKAKELPGWEMSRQNLEAEGVWESLSRKAVQDKPTDAFCSFASAEHHDEVTAVAIAIDGNYAASAGRDRTIRIWNTKEQRVSGSLAGHTDWVRSLQFSADAKYLVSGSWDMSVRVWNIETKQCVRQFGEKMKALTKICLNPQGNIIAIATGQGNVLLWDVLSNKVIQKIIAHTGSVQALQFSRDGRFFVTGGSDSKICLWQVGHNDPFRTIGVHKFPITQVVLSPDICRIVSGDDRGTIVVWNILENRVENEYQSHIGEITGLELSAGNRFVISASKDKKVCLHSLLEPVPDRLIEGHAAPITSFAFDISARRFLTGDEEGFVRFWSLYWDYAFSGWSGMTPQAERMMQVLLSLCSKDPKGLETPQVDSATMRRVILEMEYRGFGTILPETIKQTILQKIENWPGPVELF